MGWSDFFRSFEANSHSIERKGTGKTAHIRCFAVGVLNPDKSTIPSCQRSARHESKKPLDKRVQQTGSCVLEILNIARLRAFSYFIYRKHPHADIIKGDDVLL